MFYQTPQFMADLLEKVQVLQLAVLKLNNGYSLHVVLASREDLFDSTVYYISFDVTLFDSNSLVDSWDFSPLDDADTLNHTLEDLTFKISRL